MLKSAHQPAVTDGPLLPARQVWLRFGVCDRTIDRWLAQPGLGFPRPIIVNRRRYFRLQEIEGWERSRAAANAPVTRQRRASAAQKEAR
jgi:predicted DNA-binding transcriptional regulator AlpA